MDEITSFFDKFVSDFTTFDGKIIATRYCTPYLSVDANGKIAVLETKPAVEDLFQGYLDEYKSKNITACTYKDLETKKLGRNCVLATVTWDMQTADGETVTSWRESYNMLVVDNTWKILVSIDHQA